MAGEKQQGQGPAEKRAEGTPAQQGGQGTGPQDQPAQDWGQREETGRIIHSGGKEPDPTKQPPKGQS